MSELLSSEHANSSAASSTSNEVPVEETKYDNFYSPKNVDFYSKFQYSDLGSTKRHIRLLRIHAPDWANDTKAPIRCDLLDNISMEGLKGKYTTISYCAGDPKKTEVIIVNGLEFNAFANLGHALRQAPHFWTDRFSNNQELLLWADQVCINQSNTLERSNQVGFMGAIYATVEQVLVSLSKEGDVAGGLGWLQNPAYQIQPLIPYCDAENLIGKWFLKKDYHAGFNTFFAMVVQSQWWSRAWIHQEFLLSTEAYFMASFEYTHWQHMANITPLRCLLFYVNLTGGHPSSYSNCELQDYFACSLAASEYRTCVKPLRRFEGLLSEKKRKTERDLLAYLKDFSHLCEASDPRDLVYAFFPHPPQQA